MKNKPVGQAFAFFSCSAKPEDVARELNTPEKRSLELYASDDFKKLELPKKIKHSPKANYVLISTDPNLDNRKTAKELSSVVSKLEDSGLYNNGERAQAQIFYKERDSYKVIM
ncbi:MAG: hypothetical protein ACOYT4_00680 [Nanoarchaeota archaeon]